MRFACDGCNAKYMISDDKVGPAGVKVRCKKCGHVILVQRPAPELESAAPGSLAGEWWVAIDDQPVGPVALDAVQGHWDQGRIGPDSLVWYAGLAEWTAVSGVPELHAHLMGHAQEAGSPRPGGFTPPAPSAPDATPTESPPAQDDWRPGAADALAALEEPERRAPAAAEAFEAPPPAEPPAPEPTPVQPTAGSGVDPTGARPLPIQGLERTGERRIATPGPRGPYAMPSRTPAKGGSRSLTVILLVALVVVAAAAAGLWWMTK